MLTTAKATSMLPAVDLARARRFYEETLGLPPPRVGASGEARYEAGGVRFEEYDLLGLKTVEGVCVLGAERAAWFKDTEGNILCLHQDG